MDWEALKNDAAGAIKSAFGEMITYQYKEGIIATLCGVFTMVDVQIDNGEASIDSRKPAVTLRRVDVDRKPKQGDRVTRRNVVYEVQQVEELHGTSWMCMLLEIDSRHARAQRDRM
jgi:hypothetical protein